MIALKHKAGEPDAHRPTAAPPGSFHFAVSEPGQSGRWAARLVSITRKESMPFMALPFHILCGLLAFAAGGAAAFLEHRIAVRAITKISGAGGAIALYFANTALSVMFLAAVYFIGIHADLAPFPLLIGASLGLTVPGVLFAFSMQKNRPNERRR